MFRSVMEATATVRCRAALWAILAALAALCSCVGPSATLVSANDRPFDFARDTFAFENELEWNYQLDPATGEMAHVGSNQSAQYTKRCFVLARSARQFFQFARFDPDRPRTDDADYRQRVRALIGHDPSETGAIERVVIPGYASLREFSRDRRELLKQELGGWADSHFQRGNWRMVLPFRRGEREDAAAAMAREVAEDRPPVVHVADFPKVSINHALLLYAVTETPAEIRFVAYDPNAEARPAILTFTRADGRFRLERTTYFGGGPVDVYEVYRSAFF
jgi:hypothetical protein